MKDEGGRMKAEGKLLFHPSSFRLHPYHLTALNLDSKFSLRLRLSFN
jgi:hypothetical protein